MQTNILGVELNISFWFFAVVVGFCTMDRGILVLYLIVPVAIHELGHLLVMLLWRIPVQRIDFHSFGVNIVRGPAVLSYGQEAALCLGGIGANLICTLALYLFAFQSMRVMLLLSSNIAVALFNLLPIGNLDGGQLTKLMAQRYFAPSFAHKLSRATSFLVLVPLFALAIYLLLSQDGNFTLLVTCIYLAITVAIQE